MWTVCVCEFVREMKANKGEKNKTRRKNWYSPNIPMTRGTEALRSKWATHSGSDQSCVLFIIKPMCGGIFSAPEQKNGARKIPKAVCIKKVSKLAHTHFHSFAPFIYFRQDVREKFSSLVKRRRFIFISAFDKLLITGSSFGGEINKRRTSGLRTSERCLLVRRWMRRDFRGIKLTVRMKMRMEIFG